jgi:hypothetical protein
LRRCSTAWGRWKRRTSNSPADLYERYDESAFEEVLKDTYRRYRDSAFKRSQSSPIVIVSQRAMGFDLRETIINWWYREETRGSV